LCVVNFVVAAAPTSTSIGAAVVASVGAAAALLSSNGVAPTVGAPHNTTSDRLAPTHVYPTQGPIGCGGYHLGHEALASE